MHIVAVTMGPKMQADKPGKKDQARRRVAHFFFQAGSPDFEKRPRIVIREAGLATPTIGRTLGGLPCALPATNCSTSWCGTCQGLASKFGGFGSDSLNNSEDQKRNAPEQKQHVRNHEAPLVRPEDASQNRAPIKMPCFLLHKFLFQRIT